MTFGNIDFTEWAKSYSGFDGGNPRASVWMCAIEYGGGESLDHAWDLAPINEFPCVGAESRKTFISETLNIKLTKLYAALLGNDPAHYRRVYEETKAFDRSSDCCKLNLYPVAFKDVDGANWGTRHYEITGFPTKSLYLAWCQTERFAMFKNLVASNSPRLIVGLGKACWPEFKLAFGGADALFLPTTKTLVPNGPELTSLLINGNRTLLVLAPFPQRELNSDEKLQACGTSIRELLQVSVSIP